MQGCRRPAPWLHVSILMTCFAVVIGTWLSPQRPPLPSRISYQEDTFRPAYHFAEPAKWMNDPQPVVWMDGRYHLFYQYNPFASVWGNMSWGHAVSTDLLTWSDLPIALWPTASYDDDGVFTGSVLVDGVDKPTIVYTGATHLPIFWSLPYDWGQEVQNVATSSGEDLVDWTKIDADPVIPGPPRFLNVTGFRDPLVTFDADKGHFRMLLGSGIKGKFGTVLEYTAPAVSGPWNYSGPLVLEDTNVELMEGLGHNWECPHSFTLDGTTFVMMGMEPYPNPFGHAGVWLSGQLTNSTPARVDISHGKSGLADFGNLYAITSFIDRDGKRLVMGWTDEDRAEDAYVAAGWAGALSLPREVFGHADGTLGVRPFGGVAALRTAVVTAPMSELQTTTSYRLHTGSGVNPLQVEVQAVLRVSHPTVAATITVLQSSEPLRRVSVSVTVASLGGGVCNTTVQVDRSASSRWCGHNVTCTDVGGFVKMPCSDEGVVNMTMYVTWQSSDGELLWVGFPCLTHGYVGPSFAPGFYSYVDRSILEVYCQDRFALTTRVYPDFSPATYISSSSTVRGALSQLSVAGMKSVNNVPSSPRHHAPGGGEPWWVWVLVGLGCVALLGIGVGVWWRRQRPSGPGFRSLDDVDT